MLTINPNIIPCSGIKFTAANQKINRNLNPNNAQNISCDAFIKNNSNNNINFTGIFDRKPPKILGKPNTDSYIASLKHALDEKSEITWHWIVNNPKYSEYFDILKIDRPGIQLIKQEEMPRSYEGGNISRYNWAENKISINLSYLPNMALISDGNIALISQDTASSFIKNAPINVPYLEKFEDLGDRSIGFALQSSEESGKSYYYKLSSEETAELATQYIAQEMDRAMAFHVLMNTETIGGEHELINDYYNNLKDTDRLMPGTTGFWVRSYPGEYKDEKEVSSNYPIYSINGFDKWEITPSIPSLSHKKLYEDFIATDNSVNHPRSALELGSMIVSHQFMENYYPKGNNERERERLTILYQTQADNLEYEIKDRINTIKGQR